MFAAMILALVMAAQTAPPMVVESVTLVPAEGTTFEMSRGAYQGDVEITAYPEGLAAVETTTLDRYLTGVREVPSSWPAETLAAQAVAARTYLAWTLHRGRSEEGNRYDYDICASQFCQVYRGPGDAAESWRQAVEGTSGEILVYNGRPAQALYSSSAGSRTRAVQDVFGGDAVPYLQPVDSPEMDVTPFPRWEIRVTERQFVRVFERAGFDFGGEISDVGLRSDGEGAGQVEIEVTSEGGVTAIPVTRFRAVFNVHGPDLYPELMPAARPGGDRWPQTVLSYTFDVFFTPALSIDIPLFGHSALSPGLLTIVGQGWGHGVGMSQYGALALGRSGESHEEILNHYYGLVPAVSDDMLPDTVRVGLLVESTQMSVTANGPFQLVADGMEPIALDGGEWIFWRTGDGLVMILSADRVYDFGLLLKQTWRPI